MQGKIKITQKRADFINELLKMTGKEIYDKYGLTEDETLTETINFGEGIEFDIKLVICDEDSTPYTEGIGFIDGCEVCCSDPEDTFLGEWWFDVEGEDYCVEVVVDDSVSDDEPQEDVDTAHLLREMKKVKVGDVVICYDEYSHDYEEHRFKVESIENDEEEPIAFFGTDLTYKEEEEFSIGKVHPGNFVRIEE